MISEELTARPYMAGLLERHRDSVTEGAVSRHQSVIYVKAESILDVLSTLKGLGFERLSGITAVDWHPVDPRFEVVYLMHSLQHNERLRVKVRLSEGQEIDSACSLWVGANWYERETFDLFGITFRNHPNLTRIMMPDNWEGHPLRRDYPVHGHRYDYVDE